jgi:hypothetical protein
MSDHQTGSGRILHDIEHSDAMTPLSKFLKSAERTSYLSREQRLRIVEQALLLLEMNYVHLPLKQAMHAVNPLQLLKLLKYRLGTKGRKLEPVMSFHNRLLDIFVSLRDVHTSYYLPSPFVFQMAFLPFLIEQCFEPDARRQRREKFLVTRVMPEMRDESFPGSSAAFFEPGIEALYWNGIPIRRAIELNGQNQAGSNPEARLARGLDNLTVRPLDAMLPPDEKWVDLTYKSKSGEELTHRFEWRVYDSTTEPDAMAPPENNHAAIDIKKSKTNQFKKTFFAPPRPVNVRQAFKRNFYPDIRIVGGRKYGYIRLFSFDVEDNSKTIDKFVNEVRRVITAPDFPQEGLIIDLRGNPGGTIRAGEQLLQLFTPRRIKPEPFEFINTPLNLELCQRAPKNYGLRRWISSISEAVQTGAVYSMGFPLHSEDSCNAMGQAYYGPVILITDALSYSTTDIFAAGFQDNKVGYILGTSDNTGAGGANKWTYDELVKALGREGKTRFPALPNKASFDLALRRSVRVGANEGRPLEELGVTPDRRHYMTRKDLMRQNSDLVRHAARILATQPCYGLSVQNVKGKNQTLRVSATSKVRPRDRRKRIARVDILVDGRSRKSLNARNGMLSPTNVVLGKSRKFNWLVQAFDYHDNLVAFSRRPR